MLYHPSEPTTCDVSISNILIRRNKNQQKAREVNSYLKELCKEVLIQNVSGDVDLLVNSETKIDERFPKCQFLIKDFSDPFHIDRNIHGDGTLLNAGDDIPAKFSSLKPIPSECFFH